MKPPFLGHVNWGHVFADVSCNSSCYLLPSLWSFAIWCAAGKSLLQRLSRGFVLSTQLYFFGSHLYCFTWFLRRWWKRLVVFEPVVGTGLLHICQRTVFWPVSDFSYPNHVHATEVAPLLGTSSVSPCSVSRSPSSMFVCVAKRHPNDEKYCRKECDLRHNEINDRA